MTKPIFRCEMQFCNQAATLEICLELRCSENGPAARTTPLLRVCEHHKDTLTFEDFIQADPDNWEKLKLAFRNGGRAEPKLEYSNLKVQPIQPGLIIPRKITEN